MRTDTPFFKTLTQAMHDAGWNKRTAYFVWPPSADEPGGRVEVRHMLGEGKFKSFDVTPKFLAGKEEASVLCERIIKELT